MREKRRVSRFSWGGYIAMIFAMGGFAALPGLLYSGNALTTVRESAPYIGWYVLYWAVMAAAFTSLTCYQKYRRFDRPMRRLSEAAGRVAAGDFSVYLEPAHRADKQDYIDVMFQDFNKMVAELGTLETMKSDFVANVSHELKTPLAVIQSYATVLKNEDLPVERRRECVDTVIESSGKLAALVTNILKLNKLENQVIRPTVEEYDLCRQLADSILAVEGLWEEKNIELEVKMDDRLMLLADESLLQIVWQNLLSNALKFTPNGGKISVRQTSDANSVTISVSDTGGGMDDLTKRRIFDKFYQGDTSHAKEGNGLGLALVKRITEMAGGTVTVRSTVGEGSTFTVWLPLSE